MARPTKKRKTTSATRYFCIACDKERAETAFPDYNPSPDCEGHLINTCKDCLKAWTNAQIEGSLFVTGGEDGKVFGIKCPQCPAIMRSVNIQLATTKKPYAQFEEVERKHIAENTPGWRWCLAPDCRAGQVHQKKTFKPKSKALPGLLGSKATADICTCNECGSKACVPCDRPWHEGETCAEYQARIKDRVEEEDKSLREIEKVTKKCPNCKHDIQKDGGCTHMSCRCGASFCWNCASTKCQCYPQAREEGW